MQLVRRFVFISLGCFAFTLGCGDSPSTKTGSTELAPPAADLKGPDGAVKKGAPKPPKLSP
jgi:hypothetical protein